MTTETTSPTENVKASDQPIVTRRLMLGRRVIFAVISERAAVHFWVEPNWEDNEKSWGGVEFHERPSDGREPDNDDCWLLNGPCCHDGSSLMASERVIPMFHRCCEIGDGDYEPVWAFIESALSLNTSK